MYLVKASVVDDEPRWLCVPDRHGTRSFGTLASAEWFPTRMLALSTLADVFPGERPKWVEFSVEPDGRSAPNRRR